jgi:Tfp pilus assembly protein PilF
MTTTPDPPANPPTEASPSPAPTPAALPELAKATQLFETGDFRAAKAELRRVTASAPSSEVAAAVASLGARMAIDPVGFYAGVFALGLLALVASAYLG